MPQKPILGEFFVLKKIGKASPQKSPLPTHRVHVQMIQNEPML
jgi:hypothetical protein